MRGEGAGPFLTSHLPLPIIVGPGQVLPNKPRNQFDPSNRGGASDIDGVVASKKRGVTRSHINVRGHFTGARSSKQPEANGSGGRYGGGGSTRGVSGKGGQSE